MNTAPPSENHNLWAPQVRANPFPFYKRLREQGRVVQLMDPHRHMPFWLVTHHRDVVELARDLRLSHDTDSMPEELRLKFHGGPKQLLDRLMINTDPPKHTRLRALVAKAFTPSRVEALRPRVIALCAELTAELAKQATVDFIDAFAFPLPVTVISELLGVPPADRPQFRAWTHFFFNPPAQGGMAQIREALQRFGAYLQELINLRRSTPQEDLISALLASEEQGEGLSQEELLTTIYLLLVAGHETTLHLLSNGMLELLRQPEQLQRLHADRSLIPSAVEELLRYVGPTELSFARFALEDMELGGQLIKRWDIVRGGLYAANRDPEQFPEPDCFDVARSPNRHVAFGHGIHFCLGAPLARMEAAVAFDTLLALMPRLRLAIPAEVLSWRSTALVRGLTSLPLAVQ